MGEKSKYDEEPVYYCRTCGSLRIGTITQEGRSMDYCMDCNSIYISKCNIETWERKYGKKSDK